MANYYLTMNLYLKNPQNDMTIGAIADELIKYGCTYKNDVYIDNILKLYRDNLKKTSTISSTDLKTLQTIQNIEESYRELSFYRMFQYKDEGSEKRSESEIAFRISYGDRSIHILFYYIRVLHLTDYEINELINFASSLWSKIELINPAIYLNIISQYKDIDANYEPRNFGWLNILSPQIIKKVGKEKLVKSKVWKVAEIQKNTIILVTSKYPAGNEQYECLHKVVKYLGLKKGIVDFE